MEGLWRYDFCDNLPAAKPLRHTGSDIDLHAEAICDGETKKAIFEHPPDDAAQSTTLTYTITLPSDLSLMALTGFIGIETYRPTQAGPQPSGRSPDNHVQFEIAIEDQVQLVRRKQTSKWENFSIVFVARRHDVTIRFVTNNLGENAYNWAVWGEPQLIEVVRLVEQESPSAE
jgi:hypothetical protein